MPASKYQVASDGSAIYRTSDGDMIDQIAHDFYGKHAGNTEAVLNANRDLVDIGPILPAGLIVVLPAKASESSSSQTASTVSLWD